MIAGAAIPHRISAAAATSLGLLAGLTVIVLARWLATRLGLEPLWVGAAFGIALAALWYAGSRSRLDVTRPRAPRPRALPQHARAAAAAAGLAVGLVLVGVAVAGSWLGGLQLVPGTSRPAAPFAAWAALTILVATAEEGILRGALFDSLRGAAGTAVAVAVTTIAFALMHVPAYGWAVVPLDLAVGLALAGLRLSTRTILAPAIAHAVADLATWWL